MFGKIIDFFKSIFGIKQKWPYKKDYEHGKGTSLPKFGVTIHCGGPANLVITDIIAAKNLKADSIRITIDAESFDSHKSNWLKYVDTAKQGNMTTLCLLTMSAKNSQQKYPSINSGKQFDDAWNSYLDDFIDTFKHYKLNIIIQVLNEVNSSNFWDVSPTRYMEILKMTYVKLKEKGFINIIMSGLVGSTDPDGYITSYVRELVILGLWQYTDAFCFHWYLGNDKKYTWAAIKNVADAIHMGCNKPTLITEFGNSQIAQQPITFDHFYKTFGKEYSINSMYWYCMRVHDEFALLNEDGSKRSIYNYIQQSR